MGEHVFLKVMPTMSVGRAIKSKKLTPKFLGPYQILRCVGHVAYEMDLPPFLANLHNVFYVLQLRKYNLDPTHVFELDTMQVHEDLTYESLPTRIED